MSHCLRLAALSILATGAVVAQPAQADSPRPAGVQRPAPPPEEWRGWIGEYGKERRRATVLEVGGRLAAIVDGGKQLSLRKVSRDVHETVPVDGAAARTLEFRRDEDGVTRTLVINGVELPRRGGDKHAFRIKPLYPIKVLRRRASTATPPAQSPQLRRPDLVDLATLDGDFRFDIRYATKNNFMGSAFYNEPRAFLQRPAAEALARVASRVRKHGYGLLIYDAYRPWSVTKMFWDATPDEMKDFVADPRKGSRHNRGCAVDLTLYDLSSGKPVEMVSGYDEFTVRAAADYPGGSSLERWHRELLRAAMKAERFRVLPEEWWHFDYQEWREYPILNQSFRELRVGDTDE